MAMQVPASPKVQDRTLGARRSTGFAPLPPTAHESFQVAEASVRGSGGGSGRAMSYRDLRRTGSGSGDDMMEHSAMLNNSASRRSMRQSKVHEQLARTHLSKSELDNMARLFNAFATELEDSEDDDLTEGQSERGGLLGNAHDKVLEFDELKSLLLCLGVRVTDEIFDRMKLEVIPRTAGELSFDEFVTFMVTSQELRALREDMDAVEKCHAFDDASAKGRFDADSTWRWFWDAMILGITSYYMILISYEWVIPNPLTAGWYTAETIFLVVYVLDIGIYANTRCRDSNNRVMTTLKENIGVYLTKTLIPDVVGAVPIDLIISAVFPEDHHERLVWSLFRALHLLRIARIVRSLFKGDSMHGFLRPTVVYLQYTIAPVLKALFYFVLVVHYLAIGWLIVQSRSTTRNIDPSYIDALYIVLYTLSTVGYGDMIVESGAQRIYCCFLFLGGVVMNGLVISQMSVFLSKADIQNDRKDKMRETLAVLTHFDIPDETQQEILSFQHHVLSHNLGESHEELLGLLPPALQESLGLFMRIKFIAMVPMFASSPRDCQEALATTLQGEVFQPHQVIMIAGEIGNEMYFLGHGAADVIGPQGQHYATLRKGAFFGEIALLVEGGARRNASIKALTYCDTFLLKKDDFSRIMGKFPHFRKILEEEVAERVAQEREKQKGQATKAKKRVRRSIGSGGSGSGVVAAGTTTLDGIGMRSPREGEDLPSFEESVAFDTSVRPKGPVSFGAHASSSVAGPGFGRRNMFPGAGGGNESPRHRPGGRPRFAANALPTDHDRPPLPRKASVTHASVTHASATQHNMAQARRSGTEMAWADPDALAELAQRVAMLERRSSNSAPPIPSVYMTAAAPGAGGGSAGSGGNGASTMGGNAGQSSNAGKLKANPFPGALIDIVSSDDEASSHHPSPGRNGRSPAFPDLDATATHRTTSAMMADSGASSGQ